MYILNQGNKYSCKNYINTSKYVIFEGIEEPIEHFTGVITLCQDDGFILAEEDVSKYAKQTFVNGILTLTDTPEPVPHIPTLDELRTATLQRIDGKCSAAIYSGVTVGDKHYKLTATAQGNLATAQAKVDGGAESVIYAADDEEPTLHTAEQITAISDAAYKWGVVNTSYYAKLQKWIARETDTAILQGIDYGLPLPDDLMTELATLLSSAGINLADYTVLLGGA